MTSIIVVIGKNREIGCNNKLLWHIPEDLKRFKQITTGHPIVMGRLTYESIGKPLPNRTNIVIARKEENFSSPGIEVANSIEDALELAKKSPGGEEIFICGGGSIYKQTIGLADKLYLTVVDDEPEADTYFPDYSDFKNIKSEEGHETDEIKYTNYILTR